MKRTIAIIMTMMLVLTMTACGGDSGTATEDESTPESTTAQPTTETDVELSETDSSDNSVDEEVLEFGKLKIDGIAVNTSYRDDDESPLRPVYLFHTIESESENLMYSGVMLHLTINGKNEYTSKDYSYMAETMSSYHATNTAEDIYMGESKKFVSIFMIPEADLESGRKITLQKSFGDMTDFSEIRFTTDLIQKFDSEESMAMTMDSEGYNEFQDALTLASDEITATVKSLINGKMWALSVERLGNIEFTRISFYAENNFELETALGTNSGTYQVANGYILCFYPNTGNSVKIPYKLVDGEMDLDLGLLTPVEE